LFTIFWRLIDSIWRRSDLSADGDGKALIIVLT
jgi:hypothetical protein